MTLLLKILCLDLPQWNKRKQKTDSLSVSWSKKKKCLWMKDFKNLVYNHEHIIYAAWQCHVLYIWRSLHTVLPVKNSSWRWRTWWWRTAGKMLVMSLSALTIAGLYLNVMLRAACRQTQSDSLEASRNWPTMYVAVLTDNFICSILLYTMFKCSQFGINELH